MTLKIIQDLISENDFNSLAEAIKKTMSDYDYDVLRKQFDVKCHEIYDTILRPDTIVKNDKGQIIKIVKATRLGFPLQKKIAQTAAAILCANPIKLNCNPKNSGEENFLALVKKIWDDNKLDYKNMTIAEYVMSQTQCAELYYNPEAEDGFWEGLETTNKLKLKMRILAPSLGDDLYPVFDDSGDFIAFGRGYEIGEAEEKVEHLDIFTSTNIYRAINTQGTWEVTVESHKSGKISIMYHSRQHVEWHDQQDFIVRIEKKASNHSDTNDYNDSPVLVGEGETTSLPDKEDMGKYIEIEKGGKVYYVTWDQAPESTRMEIENEWKWIHDTSSTPDMSVDTLKGFGSAPSGYAIELMYVPAHLKAARNRETFGEIIQRRINFFKSWIAAFDPAQKQYLNLEIKPEFDFFLPKNIAEQVDILNNAKSGGLISEESAIRQMPKELVQDPDAEIELIKKQNEPAKQLDNLMNDKGGGKVRPIKTATK